MKLEAKVIVSLLTMAVTAIFFDAMTLGKQELTSSKRQLRVQTADVDCEKKVDLPKEEEERESRLADDCLFVYLDVGANIGVHTRFLFEPELYPQAESGKVFDQVFGSDRDNRDICSFGFEPNPEHKQRNLDLQEAYQKMGWRYRYIEAGVSDLEGGTLTFWHHHGAQSRNDQAIKEVGFSTAKWSNEDKPVEVPLLHLANWIQHHIIERRLPAQVYGNYTQPQLLKTGKVLMKMDIEGSEYSVLPSLMYSGVMCKGVDFIFGEDHPHFAEHFSRPAMDKSTGRGGLSLDFWKAEEMMKQLTDEAFRAVNPHDCKTTWSRLDDESYLMDGMPFPKLE